MKRINVKSILGASIIFGLVAVLNACGGGPIQMQSGVNGLSCAVNGTVANGVASNVSVSVTGGVGPYSVVFGGQTLSESTASFSLPGTYPVSSSSSLSITDQSNGANANCSISSGPANTLQFNVTGANSTGMDQYTGTAGVQITLNTYDPTNAAALFTYTVNPMSAVTMANQSTKSIIFTPINSGTFTVSVSETANGIISSGSSTTLTFTIGGSSVSQLQVSTVAISPSEQVVVASYPQSSAATFTFSSNNASVVATTGPSPSPNAQLFTNNSTGALSGVVISVQAMMNGTVAATGSTTLSFSGGAAPAIINCVAQALSGVANILVDSNHNPIAQPSPQDMFMINSADGVTQLEVMGYRDMFGVAHVVGGNFGPAASVTVQLSFQSPPLGPDPVQFLVQGPSAVQGQPGAQGVCGTVETFVPVSSGPASPCPSPQDGNCLWVENLYQTLLGRAGEQPALSNYTLGLDNGTLTKSGVVAGFISSPEYFRLAGGNDTAWMGKISKDLSSCGSNINSIIDLIKLKFGSTLGQVATDIVKTCQPF